MKPTAAQSGENQVRALLDSLAANGDPQDNAFGQMLLERVGSGAAHEGVAQSDLLAAILRGLLEAELESALGQLQVKEINRLESNRQTALFWGALSLHAELFLQLPPPQGEALVNLMGGEFVIKQAGLVPVKFQSPLSTARTKSLFGTLGIEWLARYLDAYVADRKIAALFMGLGFHKKALAGWIGQVSLRTLERAQKQVRQRLWDQVMDEKQPGQELAFIRLDLMPGILTERVNNKTNKAPVRPDALAQYAQGLAKRLDGLEQQIYIHPELQVEDAGNQRLPAAPEDLLFSQGIVFVAGLPGGGKTTLQRWVAGKRRAEGRGLDIVVNLDEYARSGLASIFEYAADRLRQDFSLPAGLDELRSMLIERDRQGDLLWLVDRWDRLHRNERERALAGLAGLTHALVAIAAPQEITRLAQERSLRFPNKIYHLQPWNLAQQSEYMALYQQAQPDFSPDLVLSLMEKLPGLARLPAGLAYLARRGDPSLTKTLLGYLDSQQQARGSAPVRLNWSQTRAHTALDWGNQVVNQVYTGVAALMQVGLPTRFKPERLAQIDRVILGTCLPDGSDSLESRMRRADTILETGVRSGLLARTGASQYEFAVPEIGCLMAALAVYGAYSAEFVQSQAQIFAASHPGTPAHVLTDFSHWLQGGFG